MNGLRKKEVEVEVEADRFLVAKRTQQACSGREIAFCSLSDSDICLHANQL